MLFKFYAREDNCISYRQLLKMLYSYPKEDLKRMLNDGDFITGMDIQERSYFFGRDHLLADDRVVVEEVEDTASSPSLANIQGACSSGHLQDITAKMANMLSIHDIMEPVMPPTSNPTKLKPPKPVKQRVRLSESIRDIPTKKCRKNMKLASNISLVVKKFASFLFRERGLDIEKDSLDYNQFKSLILKHTQIFTQYFEGFHLYAWETNAEDLPTFRELTSWYESAAEEFDIKEDLH